MRLALVIFRAEPQRGGAEQYTIELGMRLAARGHDVSVLARSFGDVAPLRPVPIACRGVTRTGVYRSFLNGLDGHLAANAYDVVHASLPVRRCDVYHAHAGLETISLARGHALKGTAPERLAARVGAALNRKRHAFAAVERRLIEGPRPPVTICLSRRERDEALRRFRVNPDRVVTLYTGVDTTRFDPTDLPWRRQAMRQSLGIAEDRPLLLFVGNDFARKGLDVAIRALARLPHPDATLLVVGSDDPAPYCDLAGKLGVLGRVVFAGRSDRVSEFLAAADAFVLPSRFEPFGMVVVEAMLMGVPPIVSKAAGASEVVESGVDGVVVEGVHDAGEWAEAIASVVLDPYRRSEMSEACLARRESFGYERHLDAIEQIYARARR